MWQLMRLLQERGFELKFWSHAADPDARARDLLLMHGIEIVGEGLAGFDDWLQAHGAYLDYALLSRPHVAAALVDAVRRRSSARVVYYGHDVHHLRLAAQHALEPSPALGRQVVDIRRLEEDVWARVDAVLYPAEAETRHVQAWRDGHGAAVRALTVPLFAYGEKKAEELAVAAGLLDEALLNALPPRPRKAAEEAAALFRFYENKPDASFAPLFQPLLAPLDDAAALPRIRAEGTQWHGRAVPRPPGRSRPR